jgi:hypothetical protein
MDISIAVRVFSVGDRGERRAGEDRAFDGDPVGSKLQLQLRP